MIRRIRLTDWRAYERLDLELEKPVTFVVAPNGVGKTSLMEAVKWGVFGGARKGNAVRLGQKEAKVELGIELSPGIIVSVSRVLTSAGKSSFHCSVEGHAISEDDYLDMLRETWGAAPPLLSELLMGEALPRSESAFPIREHLADMLGVTPVTNAVSAIDRQLKALRGEIKGLRDEAGPDASAIKTAEGQARHFAALADQAREAAAEAVRKAETFTPIERSAASWAAYRAKVEEYRVESASLIAELREIVVLEELEPDQASRHAEDTALAALDEARSAETQARLRAASAGSASELLIEDVAACPTCLRPLSSEERTRALELHRSQGAEASTSIHVLHEALEDAERRIAVIRRVADQLRAIRSPAVPESPEPTADTLQQAHLARDDARRAVENLGAAQARAQDAHRHLEEMRGAAEENAALVAAYRREIVFQVSRATLDQLANKYMSERITPLTQEVSRRWKLLFGSEGLRLEPDGSLRLETGAGDLSLIDLSGGERVMALFVTRILVVSAATKAKTLWLDEPLEHLDPRRRAAVARTIVRAVQQRALDQVLVTTFEEQIARTLEITAPDTVAVAYVRTSPSR